MGKVHVGNSQYGEGRQNKEKQADHNDLGPSALLDAEEIQHREDQCETTAISFTIWGDAPGKRGTRKIPIPTRAKALFRRGRTRRRIR